ncbi:zinc-ribbon domain-containing protein [Clostridium sp.]
MYCIKCGADLSENTKFCEECGNVIQVSQQQSTVSDGTNTVM